MPELRKQSALDTCKRFTTVDLFCGAGGFSLGLEAAGFIPVAAIEADRASHATFSRNLSTIDGTSHIVRGDIRKLNPEQTLEHLSKIGLKELDLLAAGPPCQGFSKIGRGKLASLASRADAFMKDPRNKLYLQVVRYLTVLRPRAFVIENVPGMLHHGGQNVAELICESTAEAGYNVKCAILNAAAYGVPQTRERVFIVGFREETGLTPVFPAKKHAVRTLGGLFGRDAALWGSWENRNFFFHPSGDADEIDLPPPVTVSQAFADLPPFKEHLIALKKGEPFRLKRELFKAFPYTSESPPNPFCALMRSWGPFKSDHVTDHYCRWTPRDFQTFRRMKAGDTYPQAVAIAENLYKRAIERHRRGQGRKPFPEDFIPPYSQKGYAEKWRKFYSDAPSWTVTAHLSRDTYSHIHYDSAQARAITLREAARLQSFPDAFMFTGNVGDVFRQIGNAVPPLLSKAVGEAIALQLESLDRVDPASRTVERMTSDLRSCRSRQPADVVRP